MKKAILINAANQTISEIIIENGLESIRETLGCNSLDGLTLDWNNNMLVAEQETEMLSVTDKSNFFRFNGSFPIVGSGVIIGSDGDGDLFNTTLTIDEIKPLIEFQSIKQVKEFLSKNIAYTDVLSNINSGNPVNICHKKHNLKN